VARNAFRLSSSQNAPSEKRPQQVETLDVRGEWRHRHRNKERQQACGETADVQEEEERNRTLWLAERLKERRGWWFVV
jgi:hypothetical protein